MRRIVITGGPGAGKSTLANALAALGHATVSDSARECISERLSLGLSPRPVPSAFAAELFARDQAKYSANAPLNGPVFFDRSILESVAMLQEAGHVEQGRVAEWAALYRFDPTVYLLPPWSAIYCNDAERDHDFNHAQRVARDLASWYQALGYVVSEVPRAPLGERVSYILSRVAAGGA